MELRGKIEMIQWLQSSFASPTNFLSGFIAVLSLVRVGNIIALYYNYQQKEAEFTNESLNRLRFNKDMIKTLSIIDSEEQWFCDELYDNKKRNRKRKGIINKYLTYLAYTCYLRERKYIGNQELVFAASMIHILFSKNVSQNALWNLHHYCDKYERPNVLEYLIKYGNENNLLHIHFYKKEAD